MLLAVYVVASLTELLTWVRMEASLFLISDINRTY